MKTDAKTPTKDSKDEIALLQQRFEKTSGQVKMIITNFQKVHDDLLMLKDEYLQK